MTDMYETQQKASPHLFAGKIFLGRDIQNELLPSMLGYDKYGANYAGMSVCKGIYSLKIIADNGITGLIAEKTVVEHNGELDQFDAMWISSLCDSTAKGKPDIELVDMTSRFQTINDVTEVTTKPIIFDGDTGGLTEHIACKLKGQPLEINHH